MSKQNMTTVNDCNLNGKVLFRKDFPTMSSALLAEVVGTQSPGGSLESASNYTWRFVHMDIEGLRYATEDGDEPEGGWLDAYARHCASDKEAIRHGSFEYKGRQEWLENVWCKDTRMYPLYVVEEGDAYRLWDGYHRLAGAFHNGLTQVAVVLGTPK